MAITSQDADKFRLKHAEELLALFEGARGNPYSRTDKSEAAADGRTSESAPSFRLGVLLLLPNSMLVSAADERIGRSAEGTLVWIIDLVGYSWRAEVAGCGAGAKYGNVSWTPSRQAD